MQAALVEDVRVRAAAGEDVARRPPRALERARGDPDGQVVSAEAVPARRAFDLRLDLAFRQRRGEGHRLEHLLHDVGELALVVAAGLRQKAAMLRDDVARGPALDLADVRRRLVVEAPEPQVRDRARRCRDRRAAFLGIHPRVGRAAVELDVELALMRRAEDHLADRSRVVVDVADARAEALLVERRRTTQPHLLHRREQQLEARVRPAALHQPRGALEHRRDGCLVVGTEDRPGGVPDDLVLADDGLDRRLRRHRVEMGAEEDRRAVPAVRRRQTAEDVPHRRADPRARVVFVRLQPE